MKLPSFSIHSFPVIPVALLLAAGCNGKKEDAPKETTRPAKTFTLGEAGQAGTVEFPGETRAIKEAVLAFEVSGRIAERPVKEGERVEKDQLLAQLDQTQFKADLDAATAREGVAAANLKRYETAIKTGAVSKQILDVARREHEEAVASLTQAQKSFDDTTLKADFDGVVAKLYFEQFENVTAKQDVLVLQDTSEIKVTVDAPESRMALADTNLSLEELSNRVKPVVELTAVPGRQFPGKITEASQTADPTTRTYEVTVVFTPPDDANVLPGMTAKVIGHPPSKSGSSAFRVPSNAIGNSPAGGSFVWKLDPETMTISELPVTLGEPGGAMIEISGELKEGDEIVVSGVRQLRAGMKVSRWQGNESAEQ